MWVSCNVVNTELREWLGLTWADACGYVAFLIALAMFFVGIAWIDAAMAITVAVLGVASCVLGMRRRADLPGYMNILKLVSYPLTLLLLIGLIVLHYTLWPMIVEMLGPITGPRS